MAVPDACDVVRRWIDAYNGRRDEDLIELAHPAVVLRPMRFHGAAEYRGIEGVRQLLVDIASNRPRFDLTSIEQLDDGRVLAEGVLQDAGEVVNLYEVVDDKVALVQGYLSDRRLLEEIGVL